MTRTTIQVNGATHDVVAPAETSLLWVLRDELGLAAAKYGCGLDQCGACAVLVDGKRIASCQLPISDVGEREVITLESLTSTDDGRRIVDALSAANAGQCGFCLPGIAVTLIELARRSTPMTRSEIASALDPHLCRCGSQPRILTAAARVLGGSNG